MQAGDALEPICDGRELRWVDLSVLLDPLFAIARLQHPADLVEEECECVEDGWAIRRQARAVGNRGEKPANLRLETRLLGRLAQEGLEDAFAVMDAAGREP